MEFLKLKSIIIETKNLLEGLKSRSEVAEKKRISGLDDRLVEII
jgi:hypothetical protein